MLQGSFSTRVIKAAELGLFRAVLRLVILTRGVWTLEGVWQHFVLERRSCADALGEHRTAFDLAFKLGR